MFVNIISKDDNDPKEDAVRTRRKQFTLLTLFLFAVVIISCAGGGGAGTNTGGASAGFDGTYNCTGTSVTPAGTSSGSGSFSCSNGHCADSSGAFYGTLDANGNFTGADVLCQTCNPLPMSGLFSKTSAFTISGQSGNVSMTMSCNYEGSSGSGGGSNGGGTPAPTISNVTPASGAPSSIVSISGTNFPASQWSNDVLNVTVCGAPAVVFSETSSQIDILIPSLNPTSCTISVTTAGGTVTAGSSFTVAPLVLPAGANVYWTEGSPLIPKPFGLVRTASINGGAITNIWSTNGSAPAGIAANSTGVYWSDPNSGSIMKVGLSGGASTTLATGLNYPGCVALDSSTVYWSESNAIQKVGITGGSVSAIATGLTDTYGSRPYSIAVDSTNVYWTENGTWGQGSVMKTGKNGGSVTTLASGLSNPRGISVDSTSVYWVDAGGSVNKIGINGGTITTLASGGSPQEIAVDSTSVYWTDAVGGSIKKVGINGGTVTALSGTVSPPVGIAVDSTSVYWAGLGSIGKVGINGETSGGVESGLGYVSFLTVYPQ